jgi:hypothetical protein
VRPQKNFTYPHITNGGPNSLVLIELGLRPLQVL